MRFRIVSDTYGMSERIGEILGTLVRKFADGRIGIDPIGIGEISRLEDFGIIVELVSF